MFKLFANQLCTMKKEIRNLIIQNVISQEGLKLEALNWPQILTIQSSYLCIPQCIVAAIFDRFLSTAQALT